MVTKVGVARGITATYLVLQYHKEMKDNYREGDWLEAAKDTAFFSVAMLPVVAPTFFFGTVAFPVLTGAAIGVAATIIIVEVTGIGTAEEVLDLVLTDPRDIPGKWIEVVGPAIREEITEPVIEYVTEELWQKQLVDPIGGWLSRRERDLERAWEITRPRRPTWL